MITLRTSRKLNLRSKIFGLGIFDLLAVFFVAWVLMLFNGKKLTPTLLSLTLLVALGFVFIRVKARRHFLRDLFRHLHRKLFFSNFSRASQYSKASEFLLALLYSSLIAIAVFLYLNVLGFDQAFRMNLSFILFCAISFLFLKKNLLTNLLLFDFPEIIERKDNVFVLSNNKRVIGISFLPFDTELQGEVQCYETLKNFLDKLPQNVDARFITLSEYLNEFEIDGSRSRAIEEIGFSKYSSFLFLEYSGENADSRINDILSQAISTFTIAKPLLEEEIKYFLLDKSENIKSVGSILIKKFSKVSVIKLHEFHATENGIPLSNVANLLRLLNPGTECITSIRKISRVHSLGLLNQKSKQNSKSQKLTSQKQFVAAEEAISELDYGGSDFFVVEMHVVLYADNDSELIEVTRKALDLLKSIGDFQLETMGSLPSYVSTRVGSSLHLGSSIYTNLFEKSESLPLLLPLFIEGNNDFLDSKCGLLIHRKSFALDSIDLFKSENNYSAIVIGVPGVGKSVFLNQKIKALLNDPLAQIMIIDVKSSYYRLCREYKAEIFDLNQDNATGFNPFRNLEFSQNPEAQSIIAEFIKCLILEESESDLNGDERAEVENQIFEFIQSSPKEFSLKAFYEFAIDLPRRKVLKSWAVGLKSKIFLASEKTKKNRLTYYNLKNIATASSSGIAKAIVGAVLAEYYFRLLTKKPEEKLILLCDESPFFIKDGFSIFKLLMKNLRKMNGSVILSAQELTDLIKDDDKSLINMAETKILFSKEGSDSWFKETLQLPDEAMSFFTHNQNGAVLKRKEFSRFLIKGQNYYKSGFLRLTMTELMEATTHPEDLSTIAKVSELLKVDELTSSKIIVRLRQDGFEL